MPVAHIQYLPHTSDTSDRKKIKGLDSLSLGSMSIVLLAPGKEEALPLPSPLALGNAAACQKWQWILAPGCCFRDGEGGRARSPQALPEAAFFLAQVTQERNI